MPASSIRLTLLGMASRFSSVVFFMCGPFCAGRGPAVLIFYPV